MSSLRIHYFDIAARAEVARLLFTIGDVPFEDCRFKREEWMELKPKTPFGQVPVLEVDGEMLAQSAAIDRFAAAKAGLLPSDPLQCLKAEQWYFLLEDISRLFGATFSLKTVEEKIEARKPIVEGPFTKHMNTLDKHMDGKTYVLGEELCYVDIALFLATSMWKSGLLDGIPTDILDRFPNIRALRNRVASLPKVAAKYADAEGQVYSAFKPDA